MDNAAASSVASQASDKLELTKDSKTFSMAFNEAKKTIALRTPDEIKHFTEVKNSIKNNTYSVKGYDVARKILDE